MPVAAAQLAWVPRGSPELRPSPHAPSSQPATMVKLAKVRGLARADADGRLGLLSEGRARARRSGEEGLRAIPGAFEGAMLGKVSRD